MTLIFLLFYLGIFIKKKNKQNINYVDEVCLEMQKMWVFLFLYKNENEKKVHTLSNDTTVGYEQSYFPSLPKTILQFRKVNLWLKPKQLFL